MSIERELLKRWFSEFGRICCNKNLLIETKELLAKRKPLNLDISEFQRGFGAALSHAVYVGPLESRTHIGETQWMQVPEPLTDNRILEAFDFASENFKFIFKSGVRWAEQAHGIGVDDE